MPRKTFVAGEILTAADVNTNLMDQAVMVFDDATARDAAITSPVHGMVVFLKNNNALVSYSGSAWVPAVDNVSLVDESVTSAKLGSNSVTTAKITDANVTRAKLATNLAAFTARQTITATNASWPVPSLGNNTFVKVTVIGGGGGGGAATDNSGGTGGTTTFNAGGAGSISASGGTGGSPGGNSNVTNATGRLGFVSSNGGGGGTNSNQRNGHIGFGGTITVGYLNLSGVSTVNVTIGAGGNGGSAGSVAGAAGGRGEIIVEYVAA